MGLRRRRFWSFAPLALLVVLGIPALLQAGAGGIPELSIDRAKKVLESDVLRRSSSPTVINEFRWKSFEWKGEGDAILSSAPAASPVRARFAKVNLVWTQTTRTRLGEIVSTITFASQASTSQVSDSQNSESKNLVVRLPEIVAFFKPPQAGWTYKWQEG